MRMKPLLALVVPAIVLSSGVAGADAKVLPADVAAAMSPSQHGLSAARKATAKFKKLSVARDAGYGLLKDAAGIACIDNPGVGGMGVHYVKGTLVGDDKVRATRPEALVYEPRPNVRPNSRGGLLWLASHAFWKTTYSRATSRIRPFGRGS
jgi:hypothetical protein